MKEYRDFFKDFQDLRRMGSSLQEEWDFLLETGEHYCSFFKEITPTVRRYFIVDHSVPDHDNKIFISVACEYPDDLCKEITPYYPMSKENRLLDLLKKDANAYSNWLKFYLKNIFGVKEWEDDAEPTTTNCSRFNMTMKIKKYFIGKQLTIR